MRYAFIRTLTRLARSNPRIMLLTGDLGFTVFEEFRDMFPRQFINVGVAEQNLMGVAAGLALTGKIVYAYSIATFANTRPFEQIRNDISWHRAPVIIVGTGAGLSYGHASTTHHAIEDIALMRTIPGMTILAPGDPKETEWATKVSSQLKSPVYLRLGMKGEPTVWTTTKNHRVGKAQILQKGSHCGIIATGNLLHTAVEAARLLNDQGISTYVLDMHTVKPIDSSGILSVARAVPFIVTLEEHSIIGGLGSAVAEVLAGSSSRTRLHRLGIPDIFMHVIGTQAYLREQLGLTPTKVADRIRTLLAA